jgi:hypothetical protein
MFDVTIIRSKSTLLLVVHRTVVCLPYDSLPYGTVRHGTVRYGTVRYGTVRYGTVLVRMIVVAPLIVDCALCADTSLFELCALVCLSKLPKLPKFPFHLRSPVRRRFSNEYRSSISTGTVSFVGFSMTDERDDLRSSIHSIHSIHVSDRIDAGASIQEVEVVGELMAIRLD